MSTGVQTQPVGQSASEEAKNGPLLRVTLTVNPEQARALVAALESGSGTTVGARLVDQVKAWLRRTA